jgi:hypothetical protein
MAWLPRWSWGDCPLDNKSMKIMPGADARMQIDPTGRIIAVIQAQVQKRFS